MAVIDRVADSLPHEVGAGRVGEDAFRLQELPVLLAVAVLFERPLDVEVIAPARELQAFVAEGLRLLGEGLEGEVSPLTSEEAKRTRHGFSLRSAEVLVCSPALAGRSLYLTSDIFTVSRALAAMRAASNTRWV